MDLVKKLAVGATTIAIALSSVTPAFAATAWNKNVSGGSFARAVAIERTTNVVRVRNGFTMVEGNSLIVANTGFNGQFGGDDGNSIQTERATATGGSYLEINKTVVKY